jgi:hypothetical protein
MLAVIKVALVAALVNLLIMMLLCGGPGEFFEVVIIV